MGAGGPGQHFQWLDPEIPGDASVNIGWYMEQVQQAEAAKFDLVFIVDSQFITPDSPPHYLNRLEPMTLLSALAVVTRNIGLVATMTTSYNDPFNLARRLASLELISGGRSGWNVVTSGDAGAAGNFSRDEHYDYDTRYARGLEFVQVAQGLWDSYEADAFPRDRQARRFLDPSRQHALNHKGDHFQVVGPLNISRSPQGQPVIFQAGDSEQGRDLGATIGEGIFTHAASIEQGQAFYADIKARAAAKGRNPDHVIVMPGVRVFVGDTDTEAREIEHDLQVADQDFDRALGELGRPFAWHDFRQYDLDAPFPDVLHVAERGFRTQAEKIVTLARDHGYTLRETVQAISGPKPTPFAGSPETVADEMQRWFEGRALDGYNIHIGHPSQFRRFTSEVVPILRERGLVRAEYESGTLRGNLGLPVPENRYTAARQADEAARRPRVVCRPLVAPRPGRPGVLFFRNENHPRRPHPPRPRAMVTLWAPIWMGRPRHPLDRGKSTRSLVEKRLRALLSSDTLDSDGRLPTERELAEMYGVSRTTVRQVLDRLEQAGLIRRRRGRTGGTFATRGRVDIDAGSWPASLPSCAPRGCGPGLTWYPRGWSRPTPRPRTRCGFPAVPWCTT